MRNYPICLPKLENLSSHKPKFARIFATTTQDNCRIVDTFVRLEETKNCSSSSVICGMSPDQRDCQWVKNDSFLTSSSSQASIQLLGMASGFSTCQDQKDGKVHFSFYSITKKMLEWLAKKIHSGECPELYDD